MNATEGAFADAIGTQAGFNQPWGVTVDNSGNVIVADSVNRRIRVVSPAGVVTTIAGGVQGNTGIFADAIGTQAGFMAPTSVAVESLGHIVVADFYSNRIRRVTPVGVVTTIAGNGVYSTADGVGTTASFRNPGGVSVDSKRGNIIVADALSHTIRVLTSLAGTHNNRHDGKRRRWCWHTVCLCVNHLIINSERVCVCLCVCVYVFMYAYDVQRLFVWSEFRPRLPFSRDLIFAPAGVSFCPVNTYGPVGSTACSACSPGTYCPVGTVTPSPCPAGFFCPAADAVLDALPRLCTVGSFCTAHAAIVCPTGQYCPVPGLFASIPCAWGTFNPSVGMTASTACQPCPTGTLASPDYSACVSICPAGPLLYHCFEFLYHVIHWAHGHDH
jgi:hypothetical protein